MLPHVNAEMTDVGCLYSPDCHEFVGGREVCEGAIANVLANGAGGSKQERAGHCIEFLDVWCWREAHHGHKTSTRHVEPGVRNLLPILCHRPLHRVSENTKEHTLGHEY